MPRNKKPSTSTSVLEKVYRGRMHTTKVQERLAELERLDAERQLLKQRWYGELVDYAKRYEKLKRSYRRELYEILQAVFTLYREIRDTSEMASDFYHELRGKLVELDYKVQKNTHDAGLLLRWVLGNGVSASSIQQYVAVFYYSIEQDVEPKVFADWLQAETIARITQAKAKPGLDPATLRERLRRARILILRYIEYRESKPYASQRMFAWNAERYLGKGTDLCVMIGFAVRRYDRESDYADIHIAHILPPNLQSDIVIIDKWAKFIEPKLEQFEREFTEKTEDIWGEEFSEELWDFDVRQAEKLAQYWQIRQQAALAEDQSEFVKTAKRTKKF